MWIVQPAQLKCCWQAVVGSFGYRLYCTWPFPLLWSHTVVTGTATVIIIIVMSSLFVLTLIEMFRICLTLVVSQTAERFDWVQFMSLITNLSSCASILSTTLEESASLTFNIIGPKSAKYSNQNQCQDWCTYVIVNDRVISNIN